MPLRYMLTALVIVIAFSCSKKKENGEPVPPIPPPPPTVPVLLKEIVVPNIPSPHYHFEYDTSGKYSFASFASGDRMYNIFYNGDKISEMRNNIFINHDTLRYVYEANKVRTVNYIDENNFLYKRCNLFYTADKLQKIEWERNRFIGFVVDRTMTLTYLPDGNLEEMIDHIPAIAGLQNESTLVTRFGQYDTRINKEDFILFQEGGNPHMLLFPEIQLQKNNPRKVTRTGTGLHYTIDYTYTYNDKNVPLTKNGLVTITNGSAAGQQFQTNSFYSYY
jgi:hypothetical protein